MPKIDLENFQFLTDLQQNNNRDWFADHKPRYQKNHESMIEFADALLAKMNEHDTIETESGKKSLYRIYRDVRFSKDKSPYKTHWAGGFKRATKLLRGGYYFQVKPNGESFVGGGFWGPNKEDLLRIREEIATDASELREILSAPEFIQTFGQLQGDQLKSAPKGFDKNHPDIDLLRYKQFIFGRNFSDQEVLSETFLDEVNNTFKAMRPFFDFMSEVLTTNSNGEPLYE